MISVMIISPPAGVHAFVFRHRFEPACIQLPNPTRHPSSNIFPPVLDQRLTGWRQQHPALVASIELLLSPLVAVTRPVSLLRPRPMLRASGGGALEVQEIACSHRPTRFARLCVLGTECSKLHDLPGLLSRYPATSPSNEDLRDRDDRYS